jgi:solute carrier family 25 phosphate transporter 23/24/25/41
MAQREAFERFAKSFVASSVARTLTNPLDVSKIVKALNTDPALGLTSLEPITKALSHESPVLFFLKGNGTALIRLVPYLLTKIYILEFDTVPNPNLRELLATTVAVLIGHPLDTVKNRLTAQRWNQYYKGTIHGLYSIVKHEGIGGLFGGVFPAILAAIPYEQGVIFLYNFFKKYDSSSSEFVDSAIWILSNVIAQTVSYPLDLVKKRLQVQSDVFPPGQHFRYTSVTDCFRTILQDEGIIGFFKGVVENHLKIIPFTWSQQFISKKLESFLSSRTIEQRNRFWLKIALGVTATAITTTIVSHFL